MDLDRDDVRASGKVCGDGRGEEGLFIRAADVGSSGSGANDDRRWRGHIAAIEFPAIEPNDCAVIAQETEIEVCIDQPLRHDKRTAEIGGDVFRIYVRA